MTNYAYVSADSVGQRSAFAQVVTSVSPVIVAPSSGLSKQVENLTSPNGTPTDNTASAGHRLRYTLSYYNNSGTNLVNARFVDTLPSYTSFISADSAGSYNSGTNQIIWNFASLPNGATATVSYEVAVMNVPYGGFVITNTAAVAADNLSVINSNEVRTTVGAVLGAAVAAVTGGDDLARNIAVSLMAALWGIFFIWLYNEYAAKVDWQKLKFKYAIWKIRIKERAM